MLQLKAHDTLKDEDYARFARFYLTNSDEFDEQYMLHDALLHLISTVQQEHLLLFDDEQGQLSAFIQYRYTEDGNTAFIDSAILAEKYRSSRIFLQGFGMWCYGFARRTAIFKRCSSMLLQRAVILTGFTASSANGRMSRCETEEQSMSTRLNWIPFWLI